MQPRGLAGSVCAGGVETAVSGELSLQMEGLLSVQLALGRCYGLRAEKWCFMVSRDTGLSGLRPYSICKATRQL
jgi:hypothetical protein